jgi:hypothetical protein
MVRRASWPSGVVASAMWREMPQIVLLSYWGSKMPQNRVCDRDQAEHARPPRQGLKPLRRAARAAKETP